ncbi:uncharacterized protein LOC127750248 isoform X3 [Frankliniella occidentalis]|uniref:Uncharacterized protein LOC127750248 isoform X3 n=1 Tax=Frankliniella occidentalis TaxID=133901 RepID=A0A9C6X1A8_FRAOC|nr:uncharacterized protein LOC127750248 isoform X3 [Frankliniella occidentalis]
MPALTRWTNMGLLDEERPAGARWPPRWPPVRTLLVVTAHGLMGLSHLSHLLLRSKGDRVYNDAGAFIAAQTTWSYLLQALLQRRTLRRLYAEMLEYSRFVESRSPAGSGPLPLPASRLRLRRLWTTQTALTLGTWAFYTASPFLFEFIHDIDLGSLRRLSAMTHPTLCDLRGLACYIVTYVVVAFEWFLASFAFSSVESTNLVFYTVASKHFEHLGASIGQDNYVMDELPFVGLYGVLTIYAVCWFADDLNRASSQVHGRAYLSRWERGRPGQRRTLHILLTRSLRPVRTRAVWVDNLSLRSFVEVLNRSYSALQTIRAARRKGADQT